MSLDFNNILDASAELLNNLPPAGTFQSVVAEVCAFKTIQDKLDENKKPTGVKEEVTQLAICFECLTSEGRVVIDSPGLTIIGADGKPTNINGDKSNIAKFLRPWSGGLEGKELSAWLGSYSSLTGRNCIVKNNHKDKNNKKISEIGSVTEIQLFPGQTPPPKIEVSSDYVPYLERNKNNFEWRDGVPFRVWKKKEEDDADGGELAPPVSTRTEQKAALAAQSPTGKPKGKPVSSTKEPKDEDIPF